MKDNIFKLTNPQMSIYLAEQFTNDPINNLVGTIYFNKDINIDLLKESVNVTIKNNQALRTIIFKKDDIPMQYFKEFSPYNVDVYNFSDKSIDSFESFREKLCQELFDLYDSDLFKFVICILPNNQIALICKFHHIITDAWSLGLVMDSITINYTRLLNHLEIPENCGLYSDFIKREEEYISSDTYIKNKDFWKKTLENSEPISLKNASSNSYKANRIEFDFSIEETNLINDFCKQNRISAYVLFLAALNLYLYRVSSYDNFTIQTPVLNRLGKEKNTIGMFINMIAVKMKNSDNVLVNDFLKNIAVDSISYFKNSKYPYMDLIRDLRSENNVQNYHIVYSFQNMRPHNDFPNLVPYKSEWNFVGYMQDELVINVTDINNCGQYNISYDYLIDLFTEAEIDFIHQRIRTVIFDIINNSEKQISDIEILTSTEKQLLLDDFNNTDFYYDENKTLIDLFEEVVDKQPDNIAIIYKDKEYSYKYLNNMANIIANKIDSYGIKNTKIAVLCKKSVWMVASLLGIMKSGNCYIPIDAEYPKDRIDYIFKNSKCGILISSEEYKDLYDFDNKIILDDLDFSITLNYSSNAKPNDLAYIIYTSGTTGNPKGVKIKHQNIINTLIWRKDFYKFDNTHVVLQIPSFSFDSSVEDIFTPLISGSTLVVPAVTRMDINIICEDLVKYKVNHFLVVPSLYKVLLHEKLNCLSSLKFITIAGESFPISLVKEHFNKLPDVRLINEYGPTENSVCSTCYELTKDDDVILIGKPINNTKCYVLDKNLQLLPIGLKGDLYVSGPGVSDGYLNMPTLTKERFLDNPFNPEYKMYKTGDIVTRDFSGNLEFVGRDDGQVKLHGFRIELKEIEKNILKNKDVSDVLALIKETSNKKQVLVAYITSYNENLDISNIYESLRKNLPFYMIPVIIKLSSFPLTPNGKIDKNKLPLPASDSTKCVAPKNELENDILTICQSVLENENLGICDDLFTIGGADSLAILSINSRLFAKGITLRTQDFYRYSNVEELAKYVSKNEDSTYSIHEYMVKPKKTTFPDKINKKDLCFRYKNILLAGVTGFLGVHILDYLLKNTDCMIYCIVREKYNQVPQKRLENLLNFYFDNTYYQTYKNRIVVLNGELSKDFFGLSQEDYSNLQKNIDCIINTAANTRHYGIYSTFERENVTTVKNLILFAKPANILLNHMSTTNVSGNYLVDNNISYNFTENDFYIGQNYEDNVYICSKFKAEQLILEEEYKGLKANIFRLGNLMARYDDGVFQKNKFDNAYYTRLLALAKLRVLPDNLKTQKLEFTPIDKTAEAIVKLLMIPNLENNIFHIFSDKLININLLLDIFEQYGYKCSFSDYDAFINNLYLQKNEKILKYIISDLNHSKKFDYTSDIVIDSNLTNQFLDLVGFKWPKIDADYLRKFFDEINFAKDIDN